MQSLLHQAARAFAEAGIPVFPCIPNGKSPVTEHGFKDASADLAQIDAWWTENPDYNLALCPNDAGWCVVDLDPPVGIANWKQFCAEHAIDDTTYSVRTPRGGLHKYFAGSLPPSSSKLAPKVDTRGRGSYVLVPPSVVDGKFYTVENDHEIAECPAAVRETFVERESARAADNVELDATGARSRAESLLRNYVRDGNVAIDGQGGDARTYAVACEVLNLGLTTGTAFELIADVWNPHCVPPWGLEELRAKVDNAAQYAQNDPGAWAVAPAAEVFASALDKLGDTSQPARRSRFHPEDEAEQDTGEDPKWLINELMQEASTVLLLGQTQSYKSFLALDVALAIAAGVETFGAAPAMKGPVFYAALEGKTNIKRKRRPAWKIARSVDAASDFYVMTAPMIALGGEIQEFGDEITKRCKGHKPLLIVIDTLAKAMAGLNENDSRDAGQFIRFCDSLVEAFGCTVVAIHHTGKDDARGARGSSAFHAGFDSVIEVKATRATKAVEVWVRKHKDAEEREKPWTFEGRTIGPSLVFFPTTEDRHRELTSKSDPYEPRKIGAALQLLGAKGEDHGVTTSVLAAQVYQGPETESVEDRQAAISSVARRLGSLGKTKLAAYCSPAPGGIIWWLPQA